MKGTIGLIRNGAIYAVLAMILLIIVIVTIGMAQTSLQIVLSGHYDLEKSEVLEFFGELLLIIIGVELFDTIKVLLSGSHVKADMVLLVAVTAVSRELIVFDYENADGLVLMGLGLLIVGATIGFYLIRKALPPDDK